MATAAVCMGAGLPDLLLLTELMAELAELVRLAISELTDSRPEPVAVERTDDRLERALPTSPVMELILDSAAELMDERAEPMALVMEAAGPVVVVAAGPLTVVVRTWACLGKLAGAMILKPVDERRGRRATYRSHGSEGSEDGSVTHFDGCDWVWKVSVQVLQRWMKVMSWRSDRWLNGVNKSPRAGGHEGALIHAPCSKNTPGTRTLIGTARNCYVVRVPILPSFPRGLDREQPHFGTRIPGDVKWLPKRLTLFGRWARVQGCCEMPKNSRRLSLPTGQPSLRLEGQWHHWWSPPP